MLSVSTINLDIISVYAQHAHPNSTSRIWRAQVKVGLLNLCKGLFSLNIHEE